MDKFYIKVNDNYVEIEKKDIDDILSPLVYSILKKKQSRVEKDFNYSFIGNKLKDKCKRIGFVIYNKYKKRRNINNYLKNHYSGLSKYLANYN